MKVDYSKLVVQTYTPLCRRTLMRHYYMNCRSGFQELSNHSLEYPSREYRLLNTLYLQQRQEHTRIR